VGEPPGQPRLVSHEMASASWPSRSKIPGAKLRGLYRVVRRPIELTGMRCERGDHLPNIVWGGHCSQSWVTKTATLIPRAARVLKIGHVLKKAAIPRVETTAEATASCRQASPGTKIPQNERPAPTNPIRERSQKRLATAVAVEGGSFGRSHDRAATQPPVLSAGLNLIQAYVASGPT